MVLECDKCAASVKGEVVGSYIDDSHDNYISFIQYTLCKCPQCNYPLLVSQDLDHSGLELNWNPHKKIFPGTAIQSIAAISE